MEQPLILITQDPQFGWVLAKAIPQYQEMQIWHQFGTWENVESFIDFLVEWRKKRKEPKTDIPECLKNWEEENGKPRPD